MRVAFTSPHIDSFVLLSGDSDLLPLVQELIRMGKRVDVVAVAGSASAALARNVHKFDTYEDVLSDDEPARAPLQGAATAGPAAGTEPASEGDAASPTTLDEAFGFLRQSVLEMQDRGSNTLDSTVYDYLRLLNPAFSVRAFGFRRWRDFLDAAAQAGVVHVEQRGSNLVLTPAPPDPPPPLPPFSNYNQTSARRSSRLPRLRRGGA
jgi:hypothetical protein